MLLGVIPMFCFEILSDFWRKSQKGRENLGKHGLLRRSVGNPRRSMGCPRLGEAFWPPRVRRSGGLHCSLATVHKE